MGQQSSHLRPPRTFFRLLGVPSTPAANFLVTPDDATSPDSLKHPTIHQLPETFDAPHLFVTSPVFTNPFVFAALRLLVGAYALTTLITRLEHQVRIEPDQFMFAYFTNLSFTGITAYLIASGTQTAGYALRWKKNGAGAGYPLQSWPRFLQALHVILYGTIITFPLVITIFYWSVLDSSTALSESFTAWSGVSVHVLNAVIAVAEILFTNSPPVPWVALPFTVLILASYCGLAYLVHAVAGFYTYPFLDPAKSGKLLAAYIVGLFIGQCLAFAFAHFLAAIRHKIALRFNRVLVMDDFSPRPSADIEGAADWEEIHHTNQSRTEIPNQNQPTSSRKSDVAKQSTSQ